MPKTRVLAICCGYEDGNDLDRMRDDPLLKLVVGRCPKSGGDLIIHRRGQRRGANLVAIEMKGDWNREDRGIDEEQLRRMAAEYGCQFLFRLKLDPDAARLIAVLPANRDVPAA